MTKKRFKPHRRFSNYVQARFDTVGNKYSFKGEAANEFVNSYIVSNINPVIDNMGVYNSGGSEEIPAYSIEFTDKVSVVKKSVAHNFKFDVFAKTFISKYNYITPISGRPVASNQSNIELSIGRLIGEDIGELSSYSVDHDFCSTSVCWVDGDRPSACTDKLKSILVNTTINSIAGSIASRGSNTDLSIHDLEQLVYKVENQQGLWDISTCTNSDMGDIFYLNKIFKNTANSVSSIKLWFDCYASLESTVNSQVLGGVDQTIDVSNLTQNSTLYSVHMLKQNIVQDCCDSIPYGSNLSANYNHGSLSTVNNALYCTDSSFNQVISNTIRLVGNYGDINVKYNDSLDQSDKLMKDFSFLWATRRLSKGTKYVRTFGFLPLNSYHLKTLSGNQEINTTDMVEYVRQSNEMVRKTNCFNYQQARIKVPSNLNICNWRRYLKYYDLKILCDYLEFGFPLNIDYELFQFNQNVTNHPSARRDIVGVNEYFEAEVGYGAMVGPLAMQPFEKMHFSPLMARPKPDGSTRVIVDLSWPHGNSVNSCVPMDFFDNIEFKLKYPTIDNVIQKIRVMGSKSLLFKIDLQRAFRNFRIDPGDYHVLGLRWQGMTYVDVALPFGFKQAASSCQMATDAITYLMWTQNNWIMAYLDDLVGVADPDKAQAAFLTLSNLLQALGLPINAKKVEPPSHKITCLGIEIDAKVGTLTIPDKKIEKIKTMCHNWMFKSKATRNQLQKLVGNLLYLHKCIPPARLFTNRILSVLRNAPMSGMVKLNAAFYKDIAWFCEFLVEFNGMVKIHPINVFTNHIFVDASLKGMGAKFGNKVYGMPVDNQLQEVCTIVHLEAANVMLAIRTWAKLLLNSECIIWCDNEAVVNSFQSFRIRDPFIMACVRSVWLTCAIFNIKLVVKHISGKSNNYADILSRWHVYRMVNNPQVQLIKKCIWYDPKVQDMFPNFNI